MQWKNAWILTRKDLAEFKKQKLVIGSIIMMPLVLGVIMPIFMILPTITLAPMDDVWEIEGLVETGDFKDAYLDNWTNQTLENKSFNNTVISHAELKNSQINNCVIISCTIYNSTLTNTNIRNSTLEYSNLYNVVVQSSKGINLDGRSILSIDSNMTFTKTRKSDSAIALAFLLNFVLIIFIVVPATLPTIIATYSIVGEKNNRSLEPLLATPITDGELLAGKILSSFIPSMGATLLAFILNGICLDYIYLTYAGYMPLPNITWILSIILLSPTACIMSILACVLISSKVNDVRAAQQLGGFVVMPIVVLMLGIMLGYILLSPYTIVLFSIIYALVDLGLFYFARAIFNRENILVKWS
jgi:ABC-2 type transport system permease protein